MRATERAGSGSLRPFALEGAQAHFMRCKACQDHVILHFMEPHIPKDRGL